MHDHETLLALTADIVAAYASNNSIAATDLPRSIVSVYGALAGTATSEVPALEQTQQPSVPIRASIKPDYLICLEDGKRLTMLKRHLMVHFGLTPAAYREKWNLPADYPMVAPNYAARRREIATQIGLGKSGRGGRKKSSVDAGPARSEDPS